MKRTIAAICFLSLAVGTTLYAQQAEPAQVVSSSIHRGNGTVITPAASATRPEDAGFRAHTHFKILIPAALHTGVSELAMAKAGTVYTPVAGYYYETPASLACLYGETTAVTGCNPISVKTVATGGSKAIAIVDAYDYPTALNDLTAYSKQFGLPAPVGGATSKTTFTTVYAGGSNPGPDPNIAAGEDGWNAWEAEAALDIEMAHAMSPSAHIYLVEANSNSNDDLYVAVTKAASLVAAAGGGEVSMSWGESEYYLTAAEETTLDARFTGNKVVFFASTGDSEGTEYPSVSPKVVAVGGTSVSRNPSTLALISENAWLDGGGGVSDYEARPSYQSGIVKIVGKYRGVPDVAAVADPRTGVWVYDSYHTGTCFSSAANWCVFGGTSVAAPLWAGIVNHAGHFSASTATEEALIYANATKTTEYRDITYGTCGFYQGWYAIKGWDPCTGNGAPLGSVGK